MIITQDDMTDDFLFHYGVKGMKWGVTKSDRSSSDGSSNDKAGNPVAIAFVVAILATQGGIQLVDSGTMHQAMVKGKAFITRQKHEWKKDEKLSHAKDVASIMKNVVPQINPSYGSSGTKMNCRRCTFAYEMRRRGFDVEATHSQMATGQTLQNVKKATNLQKNMTSNSIWGKTKVQLNGSNQTPQTKSAAIFDTLSKQPNGARGELAFGWNFGGGHSIAWEKINGKISIFDTQNGEHYPTPASFEKKAGPIIEAAYTRLDNVKMNDDFLLRWIKNAE